MVKQSNWEPWMALIILLAIVFGAVTCQYARWRECRRIHPIWYCMGHEQ